MTIGYFLVTHGSSDPMASQQFQELINVAQIWCPNQIIGGGCLEGLPQSLTEQLLSFSQIAWRTQPQLRQVQVIPLFLLPGVHVCEDLPRALELANQAIGFDLFQLGNYLGQHPEIPRLLAQKFALFPSDRRILLSHGSKLSGAQRLISSLASQLGAEPAYWAMEPKLSNQISGSGSVTVLPYFLFPGKIPRAIAAEIANYDHVRLTSLPFTTTELVELTCLHAFQNSDPKQAQPQL